MPFCMFGLSASIAVFQSRWPRCSVMIFACFTSSVSSPASLSFRMLFERCFPEQVDMSASLSNMRLGLQKL